MSKCTVPSNGFIWHGKCRLLFGIIPAGPSTSTINSMPTTHNHTSKISGIVLKHILIKSYSGKFAML
jgi:hypothetical protein